MKIIRGKGLKYIPASHEDKDDPGVVKKVLVSNDQIPKGKVMMINWCKMPKGRSFNRHLHQDMTEVYVILKGSGKITVGNKSETVKTGDAVVIHPKSKHEMVNIGNIDMKYLAIGIAHGDRGKTVLV
ncbi:cupin domain-containing protein [Patescibacteria group bacterium]